MTARAHSNPLAVILLSGVLLGVIPAFADDITTSTGKEYKNVTVTRVEPDGIIITASYGIIKIPFEELPPELREKYHYDPQAAQQFRRTIADADATRDAEQSRPAVATPGQSITQIRGKVISKNEEGILVKPTGRISGTTRAGQHWSQGGGDIIFIRGNFPTLADGDRVELDCIPTVPYSYAGADGAQHTVHAFQLVSK